MTDPSPNLHNFHQPQGILEHGLILGAVVCSQEIFIVLLCNLVAVGEEGLGLLEFVHVEEELAFGVD